MKTPTILAACALLMGAAVGSTPCLAATDTIPLKDLPQNTRYAIWGDSITEVTPYPKYVEAYLLACAGRKDIKVCTFGHSGETAPGLINRKSDLEAFPATLISIYWGMNDTQYTPYTEQKGKDFDANTRADLALLIAKGIKQRMVIGPSYVAGSFLDDPKASDAAKAQNVTLGHFRDFGRAAAVDTDSAYADVYDRMKDAYLPAEKAYGPQYDYGVHLFPNGGLMAAHEILKCLTCDGEIGTFTVDMKGTATASAGHTVVGFSNGVLTLESSRYPFCYDYDPAAGEGPTGMLSILPYLPFSQELNRFVLKVTNLGAPSANVTWGSETKSFTSEELTKGVNLMEKFQHTPFDTTFAKVMAGVFSKQSYETFMIKGTSNYFGNDAGGNVDANMIAVQEKEDAMVKALIVPVRNSIVIVPTGAEAGAPVVTGPLMAYPTVGQAFTCQLSSLNSPTSFAASGLPKGLEIDPASGRITGTPTEAGSGKVQISATNAKGAGTAEMVMTVAAAIPPMPQITSPAKAEATVGAPFSYQITTKDKPDCYFVTVQSDHGTEPPESSLPPGLTYDTNTGLVSGTPAKAGTFTMQVAAMNAGGVSPLLVALTIKDK